MAGYVFKPFPKCKYHPDGRVVVVPDAGAELALGPTWADRPFPPAVDDATASPSQEPPAVVPRRRGRPPKERAL